MLTIVMYHYVRDLERSRFPRIKGLSLEAFRGQLDYLQRRHTVVTMEEVMFAVEGSPADLPDDAALLTFDDGFIDHYTNVLPLLDERGWQGSFFVPTRPLLEKKVLDTHKLHFILAAQPNTHAVFDEMLDLIDEYLERYDLLSADEYWERLAQPSRFDPPEIVFIKRMLQTELPEPVRAAICDRLFSRYVTRDEEAFAAELYVSVDQLRIMQRLGMHIGVHGETHSRLDRLGPECRQREIRSSLELLGRIGADTEAWSIAYPFGAHDEALRRQVRSAGAKIGLTTEVARADLWRHDPLQLPRLDTNDVPKQFSSARVPVMVGGAAA
ncbi:MAG TPA: polysaccharide deacetylase family protein [Phycisphaerae bacterium]|nr:polysaccharide deacetylase family protein [Phycisphaerae bacterium]HPU25510.1 polysaccharide deacetylase family protein [Phycisphaerae bacterium]